MRSALLASWCLCSARARHDFAPLERYLGEHGLRTSELPALDVSYANGSTAVSLYGANTELITGSALLTRAPQISWQSEESRSFTVAFIDFGPDEGARVQTPFFPFVHSLWTRCTHSLADCELTVKPYLAPGNPFVRPNRYTYLLFRHRRGATSLTLTGGPAERFAVKNPTRKINAERQAACKGFSIARFLRENAGLEAVALNFAHVHGHKPVGKPKAKRARSRQKK
jgi:hypothetical protein